MFRRHSHLFVFAVVAALATAAVVPAARGAQPPDPQSGKGPWELVRSDHGITVHRRTVAGSKLHEFRGSGIIEAPIASVLAVLNDSVHRLEWMKEAVANTRIEQLDPYTEIFYSRTGAPWPVADRDVVLRAHTALDPAAHVVRVEITSQAHPAWPPQKGAVRMPFLRGHWYLWPEHGGQWTRAEYQIHADPGGMLPDWIINMVSKKIPHDTIAGMQQQVKRRTYPEFEKQLGSVPEYQAVIHVDDKVAAPDKAAAPDAPKQAPGSPSAGTAPAAPVGSSG